jgi:hypothetical protein
MRLEARRQVAKILDNLPTLDARAGLEHQDRTPRSQRFQCDRATDGAGPDNDKISTDVSCHCIHSHSLAMTGP